MSRYEALTDHLRERQEGTVVLSFAELDRIVGGLPQSARRHQAWWANSRASQPQARYWLDAGRRARADFNGGRVAFELGIETRRASRSAETRQVTVRRTAGPGPGVNLEPTGEGVLGEVSCSWLRAGAVSLEAGKPLFPALPPAPGVYRFRLITADGEVSSYVGASDSLSRRMGNYRYPGPTQPTNQRMHRRITETLRTGGSVELTVLLEARCDGERLVLDDKASRCLVENFVLVQLARAGQMIENL